MNVLKRELKTYRKGLIFWSIGMVFLVASGMAKYAAYQGTGQTIADLMKALPKAVQVIFGISGFDLTTASGFYGVLFLYIAIMGTIHAVLLGTDIISKEERDKTSEFLFVKPIARANIITQKLLAGLVYITALNLITTVSSFYFVSYFGKTSAVNHDIVLLMAGLFCLQLVFFSLGTAIAAFSKRPKRAASLATSVLLFTFILSFLTNINSVLDKLKYVTPFKYFDARDIVTNGALNPHYVAVSAILVITLIATTYYAYTKRDLSV